MALTLTHILQNTTAIWNDNNEFLGCLNPFLGDYLLLDNEPNIINTSNLSKSFFPWIIKDDQGWIIEILPLKSPNFDEVDLYSLHNLYQDMWMIVGAWEYMAKKLQMNPEVKNWPFYPFLIKNVPCIELFYGCFSIQYDMYNRILCSQMYPDLDKQVLGQGLHSVGDLIQQVSEKEPNSQWIKNVNDFLKKME